MKTAEENSLNKDGKDTNQENGIWNNGEMLPDLKKAFTGKASRVSRDQHYRIAVKVYKRLRLRHIQLSKVEEETLAYQVQTELQEIYDNKTRNRHNTSNGSNPNENVSESSSDVESKNGESKKGGTKNPNQQDAHRVQKDHNNDKESEFLPPHLRAYRLAVTDLFVEKAIAYLEKHARPYKFMGYAANASALLIIFLGTCLAVIQMLGIKIHWLPRAVDLEIISQGKSLPWTVVFSVFAKGFTAYGMVVLVSVALSRYGKAMHDQAERLMERRHALRQGRLFVHLNDGRLSVDQMEKAFNWNQSQSNAFANLKTEAQAPWGVVAKEIARNIPEILKAGVQSMSKGKIGGEKETSENSSETKH